MYEQGNNTRNLSVRKTLPGEVLPSKVTQGKTLDDNEGSFAAKFATDQIIATMSATGTNDGAAWLKLEFDTQIFIQKIVIYYQFYKDWFTPNDNCRQSAEKFKEACVDAHNNVDVSAGTEESVALCGVLQLRDRLRQTDQIYTVICNIFGDVVMLTKDEGVISVSEVVVVTAKGTSVPYVIILCDVVILVMIDLFRNRYYIIIIILRKDFNFCNMIRRKYY